MVALFGSLDYSVIFTTVPFMNENAITIIALLLLSGAMAKSANIPLHSWLPGSMEGPTPVSALIHAATLVTAGLYLLVRSSPLLEYSTTALLIITLVGATTAFMAATCGLVQNDLKRIIAFSTISQLGYMVLAVGLSQYNVALMHVVNHAFFKALLFLGAGAVIHSFADQQDVRKFGGLIKFLPFTYTCMLVGSLSLLAIPFLTGFYSKDLILELAYGTYSFSGIYAFILGSATAGLTAFYSFRLISLVFLTVPNGPMNSYNNAHEANNAVIIPLFILALFSIFFGYFTSDFFSGIGSDFFGNSIFIKPNNISLVEAELSLPLWIKNLPFILSLLGASSAIILYHKGPMFLIDLTNNNIGRKMYTFLNGKYYFDIIYNHYFISKGLNYGYSISKWFDRGILELAGPHGFTKTVMNTAHNISKLDNGNIITYAIYIVLAFISLIFITIGSWLWGDLMINPQLLIIVFIVLTFMPVSLDNAKSPDNKISRSRSIGSRYFHCSAISYNDEEDRSKLYDSDSDSDSSKNTDNSSEGYKGDVENSEDERNSDFSLPSYDNSDLENSRSHSPSIEFSDVSYNPQDWEYTQSEGSEKQPIQGSEGSESQSLSDKELIPNHKNYDPNILTEKVDKSISKTEEANKACQDLIDTVNQSIAKSSIFPDINFYKLLNEFNEWLSTLSNEQLLIFFNLSACFIILISVLSIFSIRILIADNLIDRISNPILKKIFIVIIKKLLFIIFMYIWL